MRLLSPMNLKVLLQVSLAFTVAVAARADGVLEWTSDPTVSTMDSWVFASLQPDASGIDADAVDGVYLDNIQERASRDFTVTTAGFFNLALDLAGDGSGLTCDTGIVGCMPLSVQYNANVSISPVLGLPIVSLPIDGTALGFGNSILGYSGMMSFNLPSSTAIYLDAGDYVLSQDVTMQISTFGYADVDSNFETDLIPTPTPEPRSYAWLLMGIMMLGVALLRPSIRLAGRF